MPALHEPFALVPRLGPFSAPTHPNILLSLFLASTDGPHAINASNSSVEDSVELAGQLKARRTFLVGLGSGIEYDETNAFLASLENERAGTPHVRLAYDGLAVDVDL